jgi:hypothetical protein
VVEPLVMAVGELLVVAQIDRGQPLADAGHHSGAYLPQRPTKRTPDGYVGQSGVGGCPTDSRQVASQTRDR